MSWNQHRALFVALTLALLAVPPRAGADRVEVEYNLTVFAGLPGLVAPGDLGARPGTGRARIRWQGNPGLQILTGPAHLASLRFTQSVSADLPSSGLLTGSVRLNLNASAPGLLYAGGAHGIFDIGPASGMQSGFLHCQGTSCPTFLPQSTRLSLTASVANLALTGQFLTVANPGPASISLQGSLRPPGATTAIANGAATLPNITFRLVGQEVFPLNRSYIPDPTPTATASSTPTASATPTATASATATPSATPTASTTPTATASATATPTASATASATPMPTATPTASATPTATPTPTGSDCTCLVQKIKTPGGSILARLRSSEDTQDRFITVSYVLVGDACPSSVPTKVELAVEGESGPVTTWPQSFDVACELGRTQSTPKFQLTYSTSECSLGMFPRPGASTLGPVLIAATIPPTENVSGDAAEVTNRSVRCEAPK
jgi:hypothetical protein